MFDRLLFKLIRYGYFNKIIFFTLVLNSFSVMGIILLSLFEASLAEVAIVGMLTFITLQISALTFYSILQNMTPKIKPSQLLRPARVKSMKNGTLIKNLRLIKDHNLDILIIRVPSKPDPFPRTKNNFFPNGTSEYIITYTSLEELTHFMMIADF